MIIDGSSDDIIYTPLFSGVHANYLKPSIRAAGLDPDNLPERQDEISYGGGGPKKAWKDIWGAGQGIGAIANVAGAGVVVDRMANEYRLARQALAASEARTA